MIVLAVLGYAIVTRIDRASVNTSAVNIANTPIVTINTVPRRPRGLHLLTSDFLWPELVEGCLPTP